MRAPRKGQLLTPVLACNQNKDCCSKKQQHTLFEKQGGVLGPWAQQSMNA